jgi:CRP-like cAMP-binding protein
MEAAISISPDRVADAAVATLSLNRCERSAFALPESDVKIIAARASIFAEGDAATRVFEVVQGAFMILRHLPGGRRQILDIVGPGRLIGLTAGAVHDCAAVALKHSVVHELDRHRLQTASRDGARVAAALLEELRRLRDLATALGRKTAIERLAGFLLALAEGDGQTRVELDLPVTRLEIADHLGLAIETVCRNLTQMKERGLIQARGYSGMTILNAPALRRIAAGNAV